MDSLELTATGMGMLSDSLSGLTGHSDAKPLNRGRWGKVLYAPGLTGDSVRVYRGGSMNGDIGVSGSLCRDN